MVKFLLLLVVLLHLGSVPAQPLRNASKGSQIAVLRNGLHKLINQQHHNIGRWVKAAVYGGAMLTLTSISPVEGIEQHISPIETTMNNEQAVIIQHKVVDEEVSIEQAHTSSWAISLTAKGKVAHMHLQAIEAEDAVRIAGYLAATPKGKKYLKSESVFHYLADNGYATHNKMYDGFTLPLRLSWLAAERRRVLRKIHTTLQTIAASEQELVALGNEMYRGFSKLSVASHNNYRFENLVEQIEIKFAGRRFIERSAMKKFIELRHMLIQTNRIIYKQRQQGAELDQETLNQADAAYHAALDLRQAEWMPPALRLNFDHRTANDAEFKALVESLARLKLARLLLAQEILSFYEPFQLSFLFSAGGVEERLKLTLYADDNRYRDVVFRYESYSTSIKHKREFMLGQVDFDHHLNIKKMWISLKPRGGWVSRLAKLTITPCVAGECPEPDFD